MSWQKDGLSLYRTVHWNLTNITLVEHSTKICSHTAVNMPASPPVPTQEEFRGQIDDIRPEDSASQIFNTSTLLSNPYQALWHRTPSNKSRIWKKTYKIIGKKYYHSIGHLNQVMFWLPTGETVVWSACFVDLFGFPAHLNCDHIVVIL